MKICIVNCFDTYEHRVDLLCDTFRELGHNFIVLTSDFRHFEKCKRLDKKDGYVYFKTLPYVKNMSINRMKSHVEFSKDISKYIEKNINNFDLIWALIPPNSLVKDLTKIKKKFIKIKLIFDLIDLWPETMPIGIIKSFFPFVFWRNLRNKNLNVADYIVTECNLYRKKLDTVLNELNSETLYLARTCEEYSPNLHLPENKIALCYLGSINNIIDIDTIVMIIKYFQSIKPVELHIIGDGESRDSFIAKVEAVGADVIFHGKVFNREDKKYIFDGCHYGLNIMKSSVCVGLTMKSMDYFEFGLPIINNIDGDTWTIINENDIGYNIKMNCNIPFNNYRTIMRDNARIFFEMHFSFEIFNNKVKKIINYLDDNDMKK